MLTLIMWSLGLALMPLALGLVQALLAGARRLVSFSPSLTFDEFEERRDLCGLNSALSSHQAAIVGRISPTSGQSVSASRH
ncbi:hypothetical protein V5E97_07350 [Singulisphaera sp. Ch08]|uniref:Uncharacterized protein n=1 Tax=Singulisphaera sp. Ch08 TaxID=3120278 RepID=A0AAU7CLM0_9BACT